MLVSKPRAPRRRGAAAVETAVIMIPLTMLLFGVFEYGRFLMDLNLLDNAAREGCRFALVNNTDPAVGAKTQGIVDNFMAGRKASFVGGNVTATVSYPTPNHPGVTKVQDLVAGDLITVQVQGTYTFLNIIPTLPALPTLTITRSVTMACEGAS